MERIVHPEGSFLPRVPYDSVRKVEDTLANLPPTRENRGIPYAMARKERAMLDGLHEVEMQANDPEMFYMGYQVFYTTLVLLEREGYRFPKPDTETIGGFLDQWRNFYSKAKPIADSDSPEKEKTTQIAEIQHLLPIPSPRDYYEENSHLMDLIEKYPGSGVVGAMALYELKRRQAIKEEHLPKKVGLKERFLGRKH